MFFILFVCLFFVVATKPATNTYVFYLSFYIHFPIFVSSFDVNQYVSNVLYFTFWIIFFSFFLFFQNISSVSFSYKDHLFLCVMTHANHPVIFIDNFLNKFLLVICTCDCTEWSDEWNLILFLSFTPSRFMCVYRSSLHLECSFVDKLYFYCLRFQCGRLN